MSSARHHVVFRAVCIVFIPQPFTCCLSYFLFISSRLLSVIFFFVYVCISSTCSGVPSCIAASYAYTPALKARSSLSFCLFVWLLVVGEKVFRSFLLRFKKKKVQLLSPVTKVKKLLLSVQVRYSSYFYHFPEIHSPFSFPLSSSHASCTDRYGLIHQARISASVNAMRVLNTGTEVEAAVADALVRCWRLVFLQ